MKKIIILISVGMIAIVLLITACTGSINGQSSASVCKNWEVKFLPIDLSQINSVDPGWEPFAMGEALRLATRRCIDK
jgi:hypothetical protein